MPLSQGEDACQRVRVIVGTGPPLLRRLGDLEPHSYWTSGEKDVGEIKVTISFCATHLFLQLRVFFLQMLVLVHMLKCYCAEMLSKIFHATCLFF